MAPEASLRIGIDFDNTLIRYDDLFHELALAHRWIPDGTSKSKEAVKEALISADGDDIRWQKLQAEVYGEYIGRAQAFPDCLDFVRHAADRGHRIFIVSHKTETSNIAPGVRLRERALAWLNANRFIANGDGGGGIAAEDVYFASSCEEKISKISELGLDVFIDDLLPVLTDGAFPGSTQAVLFSPAGGKHGKDGVLSVDAWRSFSRLMDCLSLIGREALSDFVKEFGRLPESGRSLGRRGNNRIIRIDTDDGISRVIKRYLVDERDPRPRASTEFNALSLLWKKGLRNIPEPLLLHKDLRYAIYSQVPGRTPEPGDITEDHIRQAAAFLRSLGRLHAEDIGEAADSRRCLRDYIRHIDRRLESILEGASSGGYSEARSFITEEIVPMRDRIVGKLEADAAEQGCDLDAELPEEERVLSPSDFGFHNALIDEDGRVRFLDFEYFGKDDPAKLAADFLHHAGQKVSWDHKALFLDAYCDGLEHRESFVARLKLVADAIGLEWLLIILNVLSPETLARREFSRPSSDPGARVAARLKAARARYGKMTGATSAGPHMTLPDFSPILR